MYQQNEIIMKTFKDLEFKPHELGDGIHATMKFEDGSEISVIRTSFSYSNNNSFEMMSNRTNTQSGVRGWLSKDNITRHMKYIQNNPLEK